MINRPFKPNKIYHFMGDNIGITHQEVFVLSPKTAKYNLCSVLTNNLNLMGFGCLSLNLRAHKVCPP